MEPESVPTNRTCCGLPPVQCPADKEYPLTCLLEKIPFSKPPACVKRQFQCCLEFWNAKFGLEDTYRKAPPTCGVKVDCGMSMISEPTTSSLINGH